VALEYERGDSMMHGVPVIEENEDMPDAPVSQPSSKPKSATFCILSSTDNIHTGPIMGNPMPGLELSDPPQDGAFQIPTLSSSAFAVLNNTVSNLTLGSPPQDVFGGVNAPAFGLQAMTAFGSATGAATPSETPPAPPTWLGHNFSALPFRPASLTPTSYTSSASSFDPGLFAVPNSTVPSISPAPPIPAVQPLSFGLPMSAPPVLSLKPASKAPPLTLGTSLSPSMALKVTTGDNTFAEEPCLSPRSYMMDYAKRSTSMETFLLTDPRQRQTRVSGEFSFIACVILSESY
jgi:hypothetical protein